MSIVLYARKSIENEASISCETQLEYCRSMIRPDEQQEERIESVDNGFSGGNMNREGFQRMMKLVQDGRVSKVIVYKLDRFSRSFVDFANSMEIFRRHKVKFISSQEAFDTGSSYGEMVMQMLMVFAQFERSSIINRITQAYAHRSELGFYMGGNQPYGFELVPTVLHGINTKKLQQLPQEAEVVCNIFDLYAKDGVSLRKLQKQLVQDTRQSWTTSKLSSLLKNPIYVRADSAVYEYYERKAVQVIGELSLFTGKYGAQLYGRSKHETSLSDWSDMKLVLLTHEGIVDSEVWLSCQRKLEQNRQISNSYSNRSSWLAGKIFCRLCGHTMTTVKSSANKQGLIRRYFCCTGKSHHRICSGPQTTIYADALEELIDHRICEKLALLKEEKAPSKNPNRQAVNELKLKIKAIEQAEKQLLTTILSDGCNSDLLALLNQKATQFQQERQALLSCVENLEKAESATSVAVDWVTAWEHASFVRKRAVVLKMVHKVYINEDGSADILWNI